MRGKLLLSLILAVVLASAGYCLAARWSAENLQKRRDLLVQDADAFYGRAAWKIAMGWRDAADPYLSAYWKGRFDQQLADLYKDWRGSETGFGPTSGWTISQYDGVSRALWFKSWCELAIELRKEPPGATIDEVDEVLRKRDRQVPRLEAFRKAADEVEKCRNRAYFATTSREVAQIVDDLEVAKQKLAPFLNVK